jgi:DNA-binding MarR family transcriptional regulator
MSPEETAKRFIDFAVRLKRVFRFAVGSGNGGLSEERFRTLLFLNESEKVGLKELSERIHISPSSLCIMLKKLEDEGFVDRSRDEVDRRNVLYRSTAAGTAALKAEREFRLAAFASSFAQLSAEDRSRLAEAMAEVDRLITVLDKKGTDFLRGR